MKLTYQKKNEQEESVDFTCQMSEAELNFLVNFAVESLIQIGVVRVQEGVEGEQEVQLPIGSIPPSQLS